MTWYAHAIYGPWSEGLAKDLSGTFTGFMYHVKSLEKRDWWKPDIKHGLPPGGLLAIQPVGPSEGHAFESWYQEPFFNWTQVPQTTTRTDGLSSNLLDPTGEEQSRHVPAKFLDYLAHQSRRRNVPIFYYHCSTWGGDVEEEFAWVFDSGKEIVYEHVPGKAQPRVAKHIHGQPMITADGDVLRSALSHIGLQLPTSYFAPHTRSFDWASHRWAA